MDLEAPFLSEASASRIRPETNLQQMLRSMGCIDSLRRIRTICMHWWSITSNESYLTSKLSRRTSWWWYMPLSALVSISFVNFPILTNKSDTVSPFLTEYQVVEQLIFIAGFVGASCISIQTMLPDVLVVSSAILLVKMYLQVCDINSATGAMIVPYLTLSQIGCGLRSPCVAIFSLGSGLLVATNKNSSLTVACCVPGLLVIATILGFTIEYLAASLMLELSTQLETMQLLLDSATDGFCKIDTATNTITSASCQLMRTFNDDSLVGSCLSDFVIESDASLLKFASESKADQPKIKLSPVMVTFRQKIAPASVSQVVFEARVVPYALSDTHVDIFVNVLGEYRSNELMPSSNPSKFSLPSVIEDDMEHMVSVSEAGGQEHRQCMAAHGAIGTTADLDTSEVIASGGSKVSFEIAVEQASDDFVFGDTYVWFDVLECHLEILRYSSNFSSMGGPSSIDVGLLNWLSDRKSFRSDFLKWLQGNVNKLAQEDEQISGILFGPRPVRLTPPGLSTALEFCGTCSLWCKIDWRIEGSPFKTCLIFHGLKQRC